MNFLIKIISLIIYFTISSSGFGNDSDLFKINGKSIQFTKYKNTLIANCTKSCIAKNKIDQIQKGITYKNIQDQGYSQSLGSYVCSSVFKGAAILGVNQDKDGRAFCYFEEDKSMIEINSLTEAINQNSSSP
jgi:hypothetical protein